MVNRNISVGINLAGLSYWSSEMKFVDVARQSQEWITEHTEGPNSHQWDTHEHDNITWRQDGYPAFLPRNNSRPTPRHVPAGLLRCVSFFFFFHFKL